MTNNQLTALIVAQFIIICIPGIIASVKLMRIQKELNAGTKEGEDPGYSIDQEKPFYHE